MKLSELKKIVDRDVEAGHGEADVVFDTEARTFRVHMVDIDFACYDPAVEENGLGKLFILCTRYH